MKPALFALAMLLLVPAGGCHPNHSARAAHHDAPESPPPRPYLLHLPGIGGARMIDRTLTEGLVQGGVDAEVEIHDWTQDDAGLTALYAHQRHERQADVVAAIITRRFRADPRTRIYLSGHSGGTGIALWALQRLPSDVQVESLLLLASAMSPTYDLSAALRHVRGKAYSLHSPYDPVLGIGTRMFGTIDGRKGDAAGRVGFTMPASALDPRQYEKLVLIGYDPSWIRLSNIGDHIGVMMRPFAREILSPLLRTGVLRELAGAATHPAKGSASATRSAPANGSTPATTAVVR